MVIRFETPKHEHLANDEAKLSAWCRKKVPCTGEDIIVTLDSLAAADSLFDIPKAPLHPHPLTGKYKGYFAVWINKRYRIIFRPDHEGDNEYRIDNFKTIKRIVVIELCIDYHGH